MLQKAVHQPIHSFINQKLLISFCPSFSDGVLETFFNLFPPHYFHTHTSISLVILRIIWQQLAQKLANLSVLIFQFFLLSDFGQVFFYQDFIQYTQLRLCRAKCKKRIEIEIEIQKYNKLQKFEKQQDKYSIMNSQQSQHQSDQSDQPEIFLQNCNGTEEDLYFDSIVGALQDTVLEGEFMAMEESFMKAHCEVFEDKEENKMEYMLIFNTYQQVIEKYILHSLTTKIPQFSMEVFSGLLASRTNQIDEDLLEMVKSFTDFQVFKNMMLEFKAYYGQEDKFNGLCVKGAVCKM